MYGQTNHDWLLENCDFFNLSIFSIDHDPPGQTSKLTSFVVVILAGDPTTCNGLDER